MKNPEFSESEVRELREFRDLQDSSHFAQSEYTAKTVQRCQVLLGLNLLFLVVVFVLLLAR